ncbi:septum formation initiator family protein [Aliiroseovarius sp. S1339]|uniref:FtsB family cell division protein n=1 Tax=Aliiroseovarius sp. S1339 TaxID=2936990 RepID=UPI0020BDD027|nr:septum formation initiator family protein [Aliiroseovarius sp. S1339]MCK8462557.1 septum formation initiator family protein [Aliiroseovarius sp. S1339]
MGAPRTQAGFGGAIYFVVIVGLGLYFTFASVQGDYGLFRRVQIEAETRALIKERYALSAEITALSNKTHRLSDEYLDLDLLDEQARSVLGMVRGDEIVLR